MGFRKNLNKGEVVFRENDPSDCAYIVGVGAIEICKKKRIGPARNDDNRPLFYKKDIGILARSGFDFETSKKVMDLKKDEFLKIINLL